MVKSSNNQQFKPFKKSETAIEIHNSTRHDGNAAIYIHPNEILALASERVGPREKHSGDSYIAYKYLKERILKNGGILRRDTDNFDPEYKRAQPIHHHLAHASSTFYASPFKGAAVLVTDGRGQMENGEFVSTTIWKGLDTKLQLLEANNEPNFASQSIGLFYSGCTYYLGLGFLEEGKTMGLAPYGKKSNIYDWLKQYVTLHKDGRYDIDPRFNKAMFHVSEGVKYFKEEQPEAELLPIMEDIRKYLGKPLSKDDSIDDRHKNLAWAVQAITEEVMLGLARRTKELTHSANLCMSGGVSLNSVANGKIVESNLFKNIFIQPASGDEGQALGKLLYKLHNEYYLPRFFQMNNAYLGPEYTHQEIEEAIELYKDKIISKKLGATKLVDLAANYLSDSKIIAWFQGRSEVGPRALGHRSILASPKPDWMRDHINFKVKHREWYRPLAPSALLEKASEYFDLNTPSPFMLVVCDVKKDKVNKIPAVTHIDGTARLQTVTQEDNGIYYDLIKAFEKITGIPVVLNTSFNDAGKPIVETPEDAIKLFLKMKIDYLVIENYLITKS